MQWWWCLLLAGCSEPEVARFEVAQFPAVPTRQLDLLILVDDSNGMDSAQVTLGRAAPRLFDGLTVDGALPDLHVGFATSDMGTLSSSGEQGPVIGTVGTGGCAGTGGAGLIKTTLIDEDDGAGGRTRNYDGALASAFELAVRLGATGCGFEQHLHAIRRSLDVNDTFWRSEASRAVIVLADEDDCSVRDVGFFANDSALGPLASFRCTRFGLVCDQSLDQIGTKTNCRPDASSQFLDDPAITRTAMEAAGRARTTFSAIVGSPVAPDTIELVQVQVGLEQQIALDHSCGGQSQTGPSAADPGLRLAALADSFASRGGSYSFCANNYETTAARIANRLKRSLGVACLDDTPAIDTTTCEVFDVRDGSRTPVPPCPANGDCYEIAPDPVACSGTLRVTLDRKSTPAPTTHVEVQCARSSRAE